MLLVKLCHTGIAIVLYAFSVFMLTNLKLIIVPIYINGLIVDSSALKTV